MISNVDLEKLIEIAANAGREILDEYNNQDPGIQYKKDESPLTKADLRSNDVIMKGLKELSVDFPIVSEETIDYSSEERMSFDTFWLVDPLDGTKEFINKNGEFAVCIALVHKNKAVVGVVFAPALDTFWYAIEGQGAYERKDGKDTKLQAGSIKWEQEGLRLAVSRSHKNEAVDTFVSKFKNPVLVSKGSVLKLIEIAKDNVDIYPRLDSYTSEWDIAAGQIILEEAGGVVLKVEDKMPVSYNKESLKNPPFLASAKLL